MKKLIQKSIIMVLLYLSACCASSQINQPNEPLENTKPVVQAVGQDAPEQADASTSLPIPASVSVASNTDLNYTPAVKAS